MNREFEENNFRELIKNNPDRQRDIARSGGIASGVSRRKKAQQKQFFGKMLDVAFTMDFASPEELREFKRWKKNHSTK